MSITFDWITGLVFGLEHLDYTEMEEDIGYEYAIVLHLGVFRLIFTK